MGGGDGYILSIVTAVILNIATLVLSYLGYIETGICAALGVYHIFFYFQFFVFGILCRQFRHLTEQLLDNKYFTAIAILGFFTLFKFTYVTQPHFDNMVLKMLFIILHLTMRYLGVIVVFSCFRKYQNIFSSSTRMGSTLQTIGRHTLDIYLIHYFLLPNVKPLIEYLTTSNNTVLELFTGFALALMVISVCLVISKILRVSDFLGHYLFGAKEVK